MLLRRHPRPSMDGGAPVSARVAFSCSACGEYSSITDTWFLIFTDYWNERLNILRWDEGIATNRGVLRACCAAHVQILVERWIADDSGLPSTLPPVRIDDLAVLDASMCRQLGEITIDRNGLAPTQTDSRSSIQTLLTAVLASLQHDLQPPILTGNTEDLGSGAWAV
jgi:hypothetical protein